MEGCGGKKTSKQNKRSFARALSTSPAILRCQLRLSLNLLQRLPISLQGAEQQQDGKVEVHNGKWKRYFGQ